MSDETIAPVVEETQAVTTAPEQTTTAPSEPAESAPENTDVEKAPKTFTQEEVDALLGKRLAKERRKLEREFAPKTQPQQQPGALSLEQFESPEAYAHALAQDTLRKEKEQAQRSEIESAYTERAEEAIERYDDFEQVAYNPRLPITDAMAETIQASEQGPDVLYYLGSNPKEAARISKLSPFLQAKEIGVIEAKLAAAPPTKKTTSAPAPIAPVNAKTTASRTVDTTDPKSVETMSTSDWIAAENARERKLLEAQNR